MTVTFRPLICKIKREQISMISCSFFSWISHTQVRALCDEVEEKLEEAGLKPHHIEGRTTGWICLDYGSVIVHIFTRDQREFYGLDRMWSDGEPVDMNEILDNLKEED